MTTSIRPFRPGRAASMIVVGAAFSVYAVTAAIQTHNHAPIAGWGSPLAVALLASGLWSVATRRPVPRWVTILLSVAALTLAGLLLWLIIYTAMHPPVAV